MGKYQAYPEYKDSGISPIGQIPSNWQLSKLKSVVDDNRKITYGIVQAGPNVANGIPYIRPADMTDENGIRDFSELLRTSNEIAKAYERSEIFAGDIVCSIGPSFGKLMIAPAQLHGANLTQGTARVAVNKKNSARYMFWVLRSASSYQQWDASCGGATFRALNLGPLADTFIVTPSLDEQQKIAAFLDHETAKIDALIEKQQLLIQLLKEKRQAVISHAVTKGLNPNAPMKDSGIEWLGEVPAHWGVVGFKKYLDSIVDYRGRTPEKVDTGIFLITARNIKKGTIDYEVSREFVAESDYVEIMRRGVPEIGDVLFTTEAPLGEVAQVDNTEVALAQRIIKFRAKKSHLINSYLKAYIQSPAFQQGLMIYATGSTALGIKSERLGYLTQLLPPISEQVEIVEHIGNLESRYEHLMGVAQRQINLMEERRTALISAAVTGKIDVRNFSEPATR